MFALSKYRKPGVETKTENSKRSYYYHACIVLSKLFPITKYSPFSKLLVSSRKYIFNTRHFRHTLPFLKDIFEGPTNLNCRVQGQDCLWSLDYAAEEERRRLRQRPRQQEFVLSGRQVFRNGFKAALRISFWRGSGSSDPPFRNIGSGSSDPSLEIVGPDPDIWYHKEIHVGKMKILFFICVTAKV